MTRKNFEALFDPKGVIVRRRVDPPRQVRVRRRAPQPARRGVQGQGLRDQSRRHPGARHRHGRRHRRPAHRRGRHGVRLHAGGGQHRSAAQVRGEGVRAAFITSAGYGEAGAKGIEAQHELVRVADELGILLARRPQRATCVSRRRRACIAHDRRRAVSAAWAHRHREPVGQLRVELHELRAALRRGCEPCRQRRQRSDDGERPPTTSTSTPTTTRPPSASRTSKAFPTGASSSNASAPSRSACRWCS